MEGYERKDLSKPDERARLGRAGRETVEARYSATVQAPRVLEIFESVVLRESAKVA